jgi:anti-anti-sigma factor
MDATPPKGASMPTLKNPASTAAVLMLEGEVTIFQAAELKSQLLDDPRPQVIDLSCVTEIDTAGIQLLMQARKMALASQIDFQLLALSPEVTAVFDLLRLHDFFEAQPREGAHES